MTVGTLITADDLLRLPDDGHRSELVRGELKQMSPSGARHALVAARIIASLVNATGGLGAVYASEAGFRIARNPDTVRAPDAAFVAAHRVVDTPGYFDGAPDVAFEVISPNDSYSAVEEKTRTWLQAGVQAVVIVDPRTRSVRVHRPDGTITVAGAITLPDLLPRWQLSLAELFA
jgi:Uma2 family endonuclease